MICLVVLGHCITVIAANNRVGKCILIFIYTVHMPAFFILSEYTLKTKRNIFDFFKSKFKLMTAYYAFSAIGVFIPVILGEVSLRITVDNIKLD